MNKRVALILVLVAAVVALAAGAVGGSSAATAPLKFGAGMHTNGFWDANGFWDGHKRDLG